MSHPSTDYYHFPTFTDEEMEALSGCMAKSKSYKGSVIESTRSAQDATAKYNRMDGL